MEETTTHESSETPENEHSGARFRLEEFEGPLDLLLFLIKRNEVNIYDIPISQITEQYLQYIEYSVKVDLENITEFYLLASTLLYIKSRMLLPHEITLDDEFDDPRRELVDQLIEYQKYKKLTDLIQVKENETEWMLERKKKQIALPFPDSDDLWDELEVWDLLKTFSTLLSGLSSERIIDLYEEVSINEKIALIDELLDNRGEFTFTDLLSNTNSVMEVVCAFLAILESVKVKRVKIYQNRLFGDIRIRRPADAA